MQDGHELSDADCIILVSAIHPTSTFSFTETSQVQLKHYASLFQEKKAIVLVGGLYAYS